MNFAHIETKKMGKIKSVQTKVKKKIMPNGEAIEDKNGNNEKNITVGRRRSRADPRPPKRRRRAMPPPTTAVVPSTPAHLSSSHLAVDGTGTLFAHAQPKE